jgi:putative nucleotidyltransferase with HDIG domain
VSSTPILAVGFLGGPTAAALVAAVGTIEAREARGEVPWYGTLYNHAVLVIAAVVAAVLFEVLGGAAIWDEPVDSLAAALFAGLAYLVVNEVLSGAAIALRDGRQFASVVRSDFVLYGLALLGLVPLAWLMAVAYELLGPIVALVFALPLYTTRAAYQSVVELRRMFTQTVRALASAIDARDPSTKRHSEHVSGIAVEIGQELGVSEAELEILEWGGLFHDIGKIGISDAVLLKPGRLEREERIEMNRHPVKGAEILANADRLRQVVPLVRFHHEWYNGSGYPDRLIGEEIPLLARILAVADAFEAMTAVRPYQPRPKTLEQAIAELQRCSGTQFDPKVVDAFIRTRTARGLGEIAADPTRDLRPPDATVRLPKGTAPGTAR